MSRLASLIVDVGADTSSLHRDMQGASSEVDTFGKQISKISTMLAGAFAASGLKNLASDALDSTGKIQDLAERIGISAEAVQRLEFAAEQGGATIDAVAQAITRMSSALDDPSDGVVKALGDMGLKVDDL